MAVAVRTIRGSAARLPSTRHGGIRWRTAVSLVGLSLLFGGVGGVAVTHSAELGLGVEAGRQAVANASAWLSTAAAQAFTMQCTHAQAR